MQSRDDATHKTIGAGLDEVETGSKLHRVVVNACYEWKRFRPGPQIAKQNAERIGIARINVVDDFLADVVIGFRLLQPQLLKTFPYDFLNCSRIGRLNAIDIVLVISFLMRGTL